MYKSINNLFQVSDYFKAYGGINNLDQGVNISFPTCLGIEQIQWEQFIYYLSDYELSTQNLLPKFGLRNLFYFSRLFYVPRYIRQFI